MRVLVIGGAGFIGSNIVKILNRRNYEIVVLDNLTTGYKENLDEFTGVNLIIGDITEKSDLLRAAKGCDIIFHLAANIGNVKSINDPVFDSQTNIIGTLNVLDCARQNNIKKIVYSSSAAIFGEPRYQPIDEKHPFAPDSPYGVSKLAGELHCLCYNHLYNMENVCLRYFNVYGINQRYDAYGNVIPIFTSLLLNNKLISIYGDGEQTRDFINVKDVAMANILAAEMTGISGVFNIGTGKAITINVLAQTIKNILNDHSPIIYSSPRKGEVMHSLADISKAKEILAYDPCSDIYCNLIEYIDWFKSENGLD
jgi:UDP-glucose 4-epimerase